MVTAPLCAEWRVGGAVRGSLAQDSVHRHKPHVDWPRRHRKRWSFPVGEGFSPQLLQILTHIPGQPQLKPDRKEAVCRHMAMEPETDLGFTVPA